MRVIPGKTKLSLEIFKGIYLADFLIVLGYIGLFALFLALNVHWVIILGLTVIVVVFLLRIDGQPNYQFIFGLIRYFAYRKKYHKGKPGKKDDVSSIVAFTDIKDDLIVYADKYYGAVLEIDPVEFRFFSAIRRKISIEDCFASVLKNIGMNYSANIVKLERKILYDRYLENEREKLSELRTVFENGMLKEPEYQARCEIIFDRIAELEKLNGEIPVVAPFYYLVLYSSDKNLLRTQITNAQTTLTRGEIESHRLNTKELAVFLRYSQAIDFDEREIDAIEPEEYARWAMPDKIEISANYVNINDIYTYTMAIGKYPMMVGDAWLAGVMSVPGTKVVVKFEPTDRFKTIKHIDFSLAELRSRYKSTGVDSQKMELQSHIDSLEALLKLLQNDNEILLQTNVYVTSYDIVRTEQMKKWNHPEQSILPNINNMRNTVRRIYREAELSLLNMGFEQMEGFVGAQVSGFDPMLKKGRGIPATTLAASYPWIYAHVNDPKGTKYGSEDGTPVFLDLFQKNATRINSNIVIIGKSGSGKSYATKSLLANLAADDSKIFVLDPENEYTELAENLHGKFINVGNAKQGRMNPFQIITSLDDDDNSDEGGGSYAAHLQFLEEFFRQILPDCGKDALEYLNSLVERLYTERDITSTTNLTLLRPEDYPIFDDLYDLILRDFQSTDNEYLRAMLRTLMNYIQKFAGDGRNASIWNGPSTITTEENFTVFNFQSLLSNNNSTITNAQMLLVLKYVNNEIIKNRDYNRKYNLNRKVIVVIDEAHVFIDEKYPIALDFMFQLAKRIRKYNGMQIVITQNIKDFTGSEDISRKSSAIINACQYSFIFPLAPNDMDDLCKLYAKAGGINESEQEKIMSSPRGQTFLILGPSSRSSFHVDVPEGVAAIFENKNVQSHYFSGEDGAKAWDEWVGDSRKKNRLALIDRMDDDLVLPQSTNSEISFTVISEEEYEADREIEEKAKIERDAKRAEKEMQRAAAVAATAAVNTVDLSETGNVIPVVQPTTLQPVVVQAASSESRAEVNDMLSEVRKMMEAMSSFSTNAIVESVLSRIGNVQGAQIDSSETYPEKHINETKLLNEEPLDDIVTNIVEPEDDQPKYMDTFDKLISDETQTDEEEVTEPIEQEEEDDEFLDIFSLISGAASRLRERTILEQMEEEEEMKRTIRLDELMDLIKKSV